MTAHGARPNVGQGAMLTQIEKYSQSHVLVPVLSCEGNLSRCVMDHGLIGLKAACGTRNMAFKIVYKFKSKSLSIS